MNVLMAGYVGKDGKILARSGAGFKVQQTQTGKYIVSFDKGLSKVPIVVATSTGEGGMLAVVRLVNQNTAQIELCNYDDFGLKSCGFHFMVVEGQ